VADTVNQVAAVLHHILGSPWLWLIVFVVAGLDALLPFMPSETTVVTVAVLLGPALPRLALLALVATAGAWTGDCLSHWIGRQAGPVMARRLERGPGGEARYEWAKAHLARHGALLIIGARYLPGGRLATGLATGGMGFPWLRFATLDLLGAAFWAVYSTAVGFVGGATFAGRPAKGLLLSCAIGLLVVCAIEAGRRLRSRYATRVVSHRDPGPMRRTALGCDRSGAGRSGPDLSEVDRHAADRSPGESAVVGARRRAGSGGARRPGR
jgi:membrane-associated protein